MSPIDSCKKFFGEDHWLRPRNMGPIPNGDGTVRHGPRMTLVHANARSILRMVLIADLFVAAIITAAMSVALSNLDHPELLIVHTPVSLALATFFAVLTVKAIRAERIIPVVGDRHILGMHHDWDDGADDEAIVYQQQEAA